MADKNHIPEVIKKALEAYNDGRATCFIFHYNILDYILPTQPLRLADYLITAFQNQDVVISYHPATGIKFPNLEDKNGNSRAAQMEETFRKAVGLIAPKDGDDPLAGLSLGGKAVKGKDTRPPLPIAPEAFLPLVEKLAKDKEVSSVFILEGMELVIPAAQNAMMQPADRACLSLMSRWGNEREIQNPIFLLTDTLEDLHPMLRMASRHWHSIEVPLPDYSRRESFISNWLELDNQNDESLVIEKGITAQALARATAGLTLIGIEDIFLKAVGMGRLEYAWVKEMKREIISTEFSGLVEFVDPAVSYAEIGGLQHVKDFFTRSVITPIRAGDKNRVPMGVLMTGPAGTGKSIMAQAVAFTSGLNMLNLRIGGQIASMWQGEGERNLRKVLAAARQFAPCIIFIDEIDQAMSRGGGAGGNQQESRIFQMLLEFMSDTTHRGEIVFLGATNRPDLLDAALKRPGRFDVKIPFFIPDETERGELFKVMAHKYALGKLPKVSKALIEKTKGWTGAEIEGAARKALELVYDESLSTLQALEAAVSRLIPSTQDIEFMTLLALKECNDLDLIPPQYRPQAQNPVAIEEKINTFQDKPQWRAKRN